MSEEKNNNKIEEYNLFVDYYDEVVRPYKNQLEEELFFLLDIFNEHFPEAKTLLECACGTGLILNKLSEKYSVK
jgi:ubiquinone/menaquinone biosynthesis C-methylase UbiE